MKYQIPPVSGIHEAQNTLFQNPSPHPGLLFERFFPCWNTDEQTGEVELVKPLSETLSAYCQIFSRQGKQQVFQELLIAQHLRLKRLVDMQGGQQLRFISQGPLALGLGLEHPSGNGFILDHTMGVPYLPASSIKGMCREWARLFGKTYQVDELFGFTNETDSSQGKVIILDAYPEKWPDLELDVVCNHHPAYYNESPPNRRYCKGEYPTPMDMESPNPIQHLTIKAGCTFVFRLLPARISVTEGIDRIAEMAGYLRDALNYFGIGAKTAVGYGTMEIHPEDKGEIIEQQEEEVMPGIIKTFISYKREDREQVLQFLAKGSLLGIFPWLDQQDLLPEMGSSLPDALQNAIKGGNISGVTLFLGEKSRDALWVKQEIEWAREIGKQVFPVMLDEHSQTRERLRKWLGVDDPIYLSFVDPRASQNWLNSVIKQSRTNRAENIVLALNHRAGPHPPARFPEEWRQNYSVFVLGNGEAWGKYEQENDFNSWIPKTAEEYQQFEKNFRYLQNQLLEVREIFVSGFAPLGIAGLIGKCWDRGNGVAVTTWNSYASEEWTVVSDRPGSGSPKTWEILQKIGKSEIIGEGENIMIGHFSEEFQFDDACNWIRKHNKELKISRAVRLNFPKKIDQKTVSQLTVECAQSFIWARKEYGAKKIYWFTGLPMAIMPLVTHISRAIGTIIFMDFDLQTKGYVEAFTLD